MKVNLLRDVRPSAISLVSKGANRKRWAMLKSGEVAETEEPDTDAVTLPGPHRIVKADGEWEAAYCVVAEPGWQEDPGVGAPDQSIPDEWADEDEIRKAAHHFMLSGGLINAMHQSLDPWGTVVENYVAPADFTVGSETIRKGSWVIAIKPTELGREAIDKGDFTGISLEGHGLRELIEKEGVEKAMTTGYLCSNCGHFMVAETARDRASCPECRNRFRNAPMGYLSKSGDDLPDAIRKDALLVPNKPGVTNWVERAGGLPKFIADIAGDLISEKGHTTGRAISIAVGVVRNWCHGHGGNVSAKTRGKACAAAAEWEAKKAKAHIAKEHAQPDELREIEHLAADRQLVAKAEARASADDGGSLGSMAHSAKDFLQKLGKRVGMSDDEIASLDEIEKAGAQTFAEVYAQRDFEDELPEAFDALRSAVFNAFYPGPDESRSPADLIGQSLDEFKSWALDLVGDGSPETMQKLTQQIADEAEIAKAMSTAERSQQVKAAMAAAKKKYPDGVPDSVTKAIFKDPVAWLASNGAMKKAAKTTDASWDGSASRFDDAQYKRSCILDRGGDGSAKERYSLPIREPDGTINVNALASAKGALSGARGGVKGASPEQVAAAKRKLAAAYKAAGQDVPEGLMKFDPVASETESGNVDSEMGLTPEELERVEGLEGRLDGIEKRLIGTEEEPGLVAKIAASVETLTKAAEGGEDEKQPTADELQTSFNEFKGEVTERFEKLGESIEKLGDGGTSQEGGEGSEDTEGRKAESIVKAYEDRNLDPKLVGIL